jgi:hypothetical protein
MRQRPRCVLGDGRRLSDWDIRWSARGPAIAGHDDHRVSQYACPSTRGAELGTLDARNCQQGEQKPTDRLEARLIIRNSAWRRLIY